MKLYLLLPIALLCSACTHTTYQEGTTKFSRTTLLSSQQIGDVKMKAGDKSLDIGSLTTSQAETTGALLGAAIKAAK